MNKNIAWGKENASTEDIIESAKDAQIHETILKLPQQYETKIGQRGVNLSGGQKQRLSIARALIRQPKLLFLDDSTSALDMKTEAKLLTALRKYDCTTFIITQKITTAMEADQIILLDEGEVIANGTHDILLKSTDFIELSINHNSQRRRCWMSHRGTAANRQPIKTKNWTEHSATSLEISGCP